MKKSRKPRLLVNTVPLTNVSTGISRYLTCLYDQLENLYGDVLDISYFDGVRTLERPPSGPSNLDKWSWLVGFFWRLPPHLALAIRLMIHARREIAFRRAAKEFDLYHEAGFFPFAPAQHLKTIFTIHDLSLLCLPQFHPKERVLYNKLFFGRRYKTIDHILCVSDFTSKEVVRILGMPPCNITVTHLAHNSRTFHPIPRDKAMGVLKSFSLPEKYFLFLGSGDPRKNMEIIPGAIKQSGLDIPLVVAGWSGWSVKEKNQDNNITFLGYVSDNELACLYNTCLAFVFPSIYEGFGLPVLEAMACSCPVVISREASLPEVGGDAALYMKNPHDIDGLAGILKNLTATPELRKELSEKGLAQAKRFSWSHTAKATFQAFEQALGR